MSRLPACTVRSTNHKEEVALARCLIGQWRLIFSYLLTTATTGMYSIYKLRGCVDGADIRRTFDSVNTLSNIFINATSDAIFEISKRRDFYIVKYI